MNRFLRRIQLTEEEEDGMVQVATHKRDEISQLIEDETLSPLEHQELMRSRTLLGYVQRGKESQLLQMSLQ